jgi:hypothetical protein
MKETLYATTAEAQIIARSLEDPKFREDLLRVAHIVALLSS